MTNLGGESTEEGIPEMAESEGKVLVEEVLEELAHAQVRPPAMHKEQSLQIPELGQSKV